MRIGILALQGAVAPHQAKLAALGVEAPAVREAAGLEGLDGLILPGGESTTFLKLIGHFGLAQPLKAFAETRPLWGVCAGTILLARRVENPSQRSLGILPFTVRRNGYGRQNESFIAGFELRLPGRPAVSQEGVFIRAPHVTARDDGVQGLGEHEGWPVALQYGRHLATTFHPELSEAGHLHRYFIALCEDASQRRASG